MPKLHLRSPEVIRSSVIATLALLVSYVIVHAWPGHLNIAQNGWANARLLAAGNSR